MIRTHHRRCLALTSTTTQADDAKIRLPYPMDPSPRFLCCRARWAWRVHQTPDAALYLNYSETRPSYVIYTATRYRPSPEDVPPGTRSTLYTKYVTMRIVETSTHLALTFLNWRIYVGPNHTSIHRFSSFTKLKTLNVTMCIVATLTQLRIPLTFWIEDIYHPSLFLCFPKWEHWIIGTWLHGQST